MRESLYNSDPIISISSMSVFSCPSPKLPVGSQDYYTVQVPLLKENVKSNSTVIEI